jgi:hypothetical protein
MKSKCSSDESRKLWSFIALLLLKLKKYYLSVFVFYCLEVWKMLVLGFNWCVAVLGISSSYYDLSLFDLVLVETILIDRCR